MWLSTASWVVTIETGEAQRGAADVEGADDPEEGAEGGVGAGADFEGPVGLAGGDGGDVALVEEVVDDVEGEVGGGNAETDHIGEAVEFSAEG